MKILKEEINLKPLVSVGLPVFNEEKHLEECIESILSQDYHNFELIISDNASTDQTERICLEFAKKDNRIIYSRNKVNIGMLKNGYKVFIKSKGQFYMPAGGHDLWSSSFMSTCVKTLLDYPETVLSFGSTVWMDEYNQPIIKSSPFYDTRGCDPVTRFMYVLWGTMNPIYGIIRLSDMKKIKIQTDIIGGDLIMLSELSFIGEFAYNPEAIWFRRMQHGAETIQQKTERYKKDLFSKKIGLVAILLHIRIPIELWRSIAKARISLREKMYMFMISIVAFPIKYLISKK